MLQDVGCKNMAAISFLFFTKKEEFFMQTVKYDLFKKEKGLLPEGQEWALGRPGSRQAGLRQAGLR